MNPASTHAGEVSPISDPEVPLRSNHGPRAAAANPLPRARYLAAEKEDREARRQAKLGNYSAGQPTTKPLVDGEGDDPEQAEFYHAHHVSRAHTLVNSPSMLNDGSC